MDGARPRARAGASSLRARPGARRLRAGTDRQRPGEQDRIEIRVGPALETVAGLDGSFDFVFIDADKEGYPAYLDAALEKLAPRGLIVADNMLRDGRCCEDDADVDAGTVAIKAFNARVAADPSLVSVLLTVRDGLTLVRRA